MKLPRKPTAAVINPFTKEKLYSAKQMEEYAKASIKLHSRCTSCDSTGDLTSFDGEWKGYCKCLAGEELRNKK